MRCREVPWDDRTNPGPLRPTTTGNILEVVEGEGRFLHREQPVAMMRKLLAFLNVN
jgi:hypothetical protein